MKFSFKIRATLFIFFLLSGLFTTVHAQENDTTSSGGSNVDEIAEKLNNPTAAIGSMNTFIDFKTYDGDLTDASDQTSWSLTFQPSLPKPLGKGINLLVRPAIPLIIKQPVYKGTEGFEDSGVQLGNISFDLAAGGVTKSGLLLMGGLVVGLPTASSKDIRGQFTLGPEFAVGYISKKFIGGVLVTQSWDVEDDPLKKTNVLGGQYFYFIPIGNGRTIGASPLFSYDWNSEDLLLPVGIGYSSVTAFGKMPFKYGLFVFYSAVTPDSFAQLWQVRLQLTPVVNLPWK
jgi:hypothetical protein